jgi:protein TonB
VGAVAAAENLVAAIPTASGPSPRRSLPAASNAPPAAVAAARPAPPLPVGGSVQAGKVLSQPGPAYPAVARAAGIQGLVRLEAVITKDGTVRDLKVLSGNQVLAEAALDAVRRWRYQPTKLDGEPIEVRTDIDVDFKLP